MLSVIKMRWCHIVIWMKSNSNLNLKNWMKICNNIWLMHMSRFFQFCVYLFSVLIGFFINMIVIVNEVGPSHKSLSPSPPNDQLFSQSPIMIWRGFDKHNSHFSPSLPHICVESIGSIPLIFIDPHISKA